jgi:hypothetical protein
MTPQVAIDVNTKLMAAKYVKRNNKRVALRVNRDLEGKVGGQAMVVGNE